MGFGADLTASEDEGVSKFFRGAPGDRQRVIGASPKR